MDHKKKARPDDKYFSQDADFGVFQPMREPPMTSTQYPTPQYPASQYPAYAAWTQFSGIPPSPGDTASFGWDSFVTPPSTPAQNEDFNNPQYFSTLDSVMQAMGKTGANFDANITSDTDKLASTPLAQSLLEALSASNPDLNSVQSGSLPQMQGPLNYEQASLDGFEMYAEALKKLGSGYQPYNPFGTSDVPNASPCTTPPPREYDHHGNLKPSFAEVAKTLKSSQSKEKEEPEPRTRRVSESTAASRSFKGNKKFVPRPNRNRNNSVPDDLCKSTVSPDSKYGLDDFSVIGDRKNEKEDKSSDGTPVVTRTNSTSSLSSGTSGIEEIHLTKSCNSFPNTTQDTTSFEKISNKDKEKGLDKENVKSTTKEEKPFFDARRIFGSQTKDTNKRRGQGKTLDEEVGPTILNNGKPSYTGWGSPSAHKKSTHYINNNLKDSRDSQKKTNQDPTTGLKGQAIPPENVYPSESHTKSEKPVRSRHGSTKSRSAEKRDLPLQTSFDHELIDEWLSFLYDKGKLCLHQLWTLVLMVILLIFSIIVYLVSGCVHIISWLWGKLWLFLENKVFKGKLFGGRSWRKTAAETPKKVGLEENIALPATGEEAMQRLLACKGKDPYSILGLKHTATDDDIKKYYRRQAVLVHPDKNQQPGAEESFKILGHAFELIGDASKREAYDRQLQEAKEAEAAMREFNDLLTKLQEKIHQASNMMRCDNCGGKHKRVPVERPWYSARHCDRCSIRHSAKEGDVWAETSMLGFLWHYYACMEGKVFDITEWVACKKEFFKHMQANAHHVFYRIATEGNRGHRNKTNTDKHGGPDAAGASSEADLENFISHLFHQAMNSDGTSSGGPSQSWQPPQSNGQPWNSTGNSQPTSTSHSTSTGQGKRQRRKKKKH